MSLNIITRYSFFHFFLAFFCGLEVLKLLNFSNRSLFCILSSGYCGCFISSSRDIASVSFCVLQHIGGHPNAVGGSFQYLCSSTLYLQQGRGSSLVSQFLQKLLWRHNVTFYSRSSFNNSSLSLPSQSIFFNVLFTAVVSAFRWVTKARLKASDPMFI